MGALGALADRELVLRARSGESDAFAELVKRYMRPAFAVALSVTGNREDAEDAAHEAFVVALERLEECRRPERFAGWFLTIARNRAKNIVRREVLRAGDPLPHSARSATANPEKSTEQAELRGRLMDALSQLPEVHREIVLLHDLEGWKHREIAQRLGLPSGTVRSHLHFARKALREHLGDVFAQEEIGEGQ